MLMDNIRTTCYFNSITCNPTDFKDKIIMDVGTGSGILAMFAAKAGASKVYAIEASNASEWATTLV